MSPTWIWDREFKRMKCCWTSLTINWTSNRNVPVYLYFFALRRSLRLVIQTVVYCDANLVRTQVYITQYICNFIDSIYIRKIPHTSILYRYIVQTNLSVTYIQQKYSYPYHIFSVLYKTCCINIVTWYVKEM